MNTKPSSKYPSANIFICCFLLIIIAGGCSPHVDLPEQRLESLLPQLLEESGNPGIAIAVVRDGTVTWQGSFGVKNMENNQPVDQSTVFEAASLSKPVFAYAVLRMVERGQLDLDKSLAEYLTYDRLAHEEHYKKITARMVLSHSTGLPNWGGDKLNLLFDPGSRFSYSGEGYVYLQRVVEKLTGQSLNQVMQAEVFGPLDMSQSSYVWTASYDSDSATPHSSLGRALKKQKPEKANAAASLHTTAVDYAKFVTAVLEHQGLSEETVTNMLMPQIRVTNRKATDLPGDLYWGLGWGLQVNDGRKAIWHWGDNGPFKAYVLGYPDLRAGFVYFANSQDGLSIAGAIASAFQEDIHSAVMYLDYEAHDSPRRQAKFEIARAFMDEGNDAGIRKYQQLRKENPETFNEEETNSLGYLFLRDEKAEAALAVLKINAENYPESPNVHDSLGEAYLTAGFLEETVACYEKAAELDPDNEQARDRIKFVKEEVQAWQNPVALSRGALERFQGTFGNRKFAVEGGNLYYTRAGNPPGLLTALSEDTFLVEDVPGFRLQFIPDDSGEIIKVVGRYLNGRSDESPKNP